MRKRDIIRQVDEVGRDSKKSKAMRIEALQPKVACGRLLFRRDQRSIADQLILWDPLSRNNDDDEIDALAWQVGLWRKPIDDSPEPEVKVGTFADDAEEIIHSQERNGWLENMFADMPSDI